MNLKTILVVSALSVTAAANAINLAYYNFNGGVTGTPGVPNLVVSSTATGVASTLTTTNGNVDTFTGTTVNAQGGAVAGTDLALTNGLNGVNNGSTLTVNVSSATQTLSNLAISFANRRSGTGFNNIQLAYSVNGGSFVDFGGNISATNTTYVVQSAGPIAAITGASNVQLRLTFTGGTATSTSGNSRIDNLLVTGDVQAVPEPASMAALGLGVAAMIRRRRSAK